MTTDIQASDFTVSWSIMLPPAEEHHAVIPGLGRCAALLSVRLLVALHGAWGPGRGEWCVRVKCCDQMRGLSHVLTDRGAGRVSSAEILMWSP